MSSFFYYCFAERSQLKKQRIRPKTSCTSLRRRIITSFSGNVSFSRISGSHAPKRRCSHVVLTREWKTEKNHRRLIASIFIHLYLTLYYQCRKGQTLKLGHTYSRSKKFLHTLNNMRKSCDGWEIAFHVSSFPPAVQSRTEKSGPLNFMPRVHKYAANR